MKWQTVVFVAAILWILSSRPTLAPGRKIDISKIQTQKGNT